MNSVQPDHMPIEVLPPLLNSAANKAEAPPAAKAARQVAGVADKGMFIVDLSVSDMKKLPNGTIVITPKKMQEAVQKEVSVPADQRTSRAKMCAIALLVCVLFVAIMAFMVPVVGAVGVLAAAVIAIGAVGSRPVSASDFVRQEPSAPPVS